MAKDKEKAKEKKKDEKDKAQGPEKKKPSFAKDKAVVTQHQVTVDGQEIAYTATAGRLVLKKEDDTPEAAMFFVAYTRDGVDDVGSRPVTFAFNGGPGSSSVWLHIGVLGPRRVLMEDDGSPLQPPYKLVDNAYSLLDKTDLVFIDPVSTGFSRAVEEENAKDYHGFEKDIESVGEFIRLYLTRYRRWASPKFLAGESYGTTRASGLSAHLQNKLGIYLNGIILISAVLNFQTILFNVGNDLPYIVYLPTYAATAWYHGKLAPELQENFEATLAEVSEFARTEYTLALMKGAELDERTRAQIVRKLARYTGLSKEYIQRTNLRIHIMRFTKELLRDTRQTVGRFDSRFMGKDRDAAGEMFEYDPSYPIVQGPYTAMLNDYLRRELNFKSDLPYEILTGRVHPWDYGTHQNRYVNVAEGLRSAMTQNPALKVLVANGYYDLATPYLGTEYTFNHLELDPGLQDHITMTYYHAGHMMYLHKASLEKLKADMAAFIDKTLGQ